MHSNDVKLLDEIRNDVHGANTLRDWVGAGGIPVHEDHAIRRAATCATCPQNEKGNWWDYAKSKLADAIRTQLTIKNRMALHVPHEEKLGTCQICSCNLPLKVWTPLKHVTDNLSHKNFEALPSWCWIKRELLEDNS